MARLLAAGLFGLFVVLTAPAAPASAHAELVSTVPAAGAVLTSAPRQVVITFSERITPVTNKIQVIAPDGTRINSGIPLATGGQLTIPVRAAVPRGTYLVSYRVISADSHPVGASFTYSVGAPSAVAPDPGTAAGGTEPTVAVAMAVARDLGYLGLILVMGPALVLYALWPRRLDRAGPTALAFGGLGLIALSTLLELYLQAPYSAGTGLLQVSVADLRSVFSVMFGKAHVVRLGVLVAISMPLAEHLAGKGGRAGRVALVVLAAIGLGTWSVGGHPGTSVAPLLTIVADVAHLTAMSVWLGGLVMLAWYLLRRARDSELRAILPVWSNWATVAVAVLVLSGAAQALIQIGTVGALLHTSYGVLVLAKVGLLGVILGVAALSRRLVTRIAPPVPQADGLAMVAAPVPDLVAADGQPAGPVPAESPAGSLTESLTEPVPGGPVPTGPQAPPAEPAPPGEQAGLVRRLRRSVLIEAFGAVVILAVTAALVQTTPARDAAAVADQQRGGPYSATLASTLFQVEVDIDPVRPGDNDVHLYAYSPQGAPLTVIRWTASAALPGSGLEPIQIPLLPISDSHATGQVNLPTAGQWQFSVTLQVSKFDEATVSTVIAVK